MKKYTKPTTEWTEIENLMPLASSPGISKDPAPGGAEGNSLGEGNAPIVWDTNEQDN